MKEFADGQKGVCRLASCDTMYLTDLRRELPMPATTMVHVRVDEHIKTQASETLAGMGLTVSDAIRVFLTRIVADQQLPFAIKAPNAGTRAAMKEARAMSKIRFASARELINDLEEAAKQ
jgi:DNA-damage-inducible protein J